MRIVIEKSIQELIQESLEKIAAAWPIEEWQNAMLHPAIVENVHSEPHSLSDHFNEKEERWTILMPTEPGTLFILDHALHENEIANYGGGARKGQDPTFNTDDLISVVVYGDEKTSVLELRIIHELLHGLNLPSDDLHAYSNQAFKLSIRCIYSLFHKLRIPAEHFPFFQRRFYHWLLLSRKKGTM